MNTQRPMVTGPDGNDRPALEQRARAMSESDAARLLTLADEPELILQPGESVPVLDPDDVAAARLRNDWMIAETMESPTFAMAEAAQASINRAMAQLESI